MLFKFPTAVFKYMLACLILLAGSFSAKASDAYVLNSYEVWGMMRFRKSKQILDI